MAKFEVGVVILALFAIAYAGRQEENSQEADADVNRNGGVPLRDEWYKQRPNFTDLPRIFDDSAPCPAKRFYLDCNHCICRKEDSNLLDCTFVGCPPIPQIVNWGKEGVVCPAARKFYAKCNDCKCDSEGKTALCTKKNCPSPSLDPSK